MIQNKLEVLGKAGLSEDVLEADCTFFKVLITFPEHECSQILYVKSCREFLQSIFVWCFVCEGKGKGKEGFYLEKSLMKFFVEQCTYREKVKAVVFRSDGFVSAIIIWLCLTRTGNYQIHEFDWLKWILTAV